MDNTITNILEWTSSGTNPPDGPTGLSAKATNTQVPAGLESFGGRDQRHYNVKRSTTSGGPFTNIIATTTATNYTDNSVVSGPTYYYVVSAIDPFGESTNSLPASASLFDPGYQLSVTPASQTVTGGTATTYTVNLTTNSHFSGSVTLGASGAPATVTASFSPPSLSQAGSTTLTVQTTTNTPGGTYFFTIAGTNGTSVITTNITLVVNGVGTIPGTLFWTGASGQGQIGPAQCSIGRT